MVCQDPEHTHSDGCYEAVTLVKWVVELKEESSSAYAAEKGLPIHFFVSSLEEAQDPWGDYENYKSDLWGKRDGANTDTVGAYANADILDGATGDQIQTRNGIRASMSEDEIIKYVAQWPNGGSADDFRKFTGNIRIGGVNYSGDEYEVQWVTICWRGNDGEGTSLTCYCGVNYPHIHIDGILTKKIQPGTMKLSKRIDTPKSTDQTFNFKLYQLALDSNYRPTDQTIGAGVDMVATIPANSTTATITPVDPSTEFGFGYYKLVEQPNDKWLQSGLQIGTTNYTTTGPLYICIHTDGSVQYSTSYSAGYRTATDGATVVNTPIPTMEISVSKVWDDNSNQDGIRPDSLTVHLLQNNTHYGTTLTLNAANNWQAQWEDLPVTDSLGNTYSYTVEEVVPTGYTASVSGSAAGGFVLTNSHTPATTAVHARKVWNDDNNRDGVRPDSVTLQLYKALSENSSKTPVGAPVSVSAANNWATVWENLPAKEGGVDIIYSVQETTVPNGYTAGYGKDSHTGELLVTNSHELERTSIEITKTWADADDQDGIRPDSITLNLFFDGTPLLDANGKQVTLTVTPGAAEDSQKAVFSADAKTATGVVVPLSATVSASGNTWTVTVSNLLKYVSGHVRQETVYSFGEAAINGYTMTDSQGNTVTSVTAVDGKAAITNKHTPTTVDLPVVKEWNDAEDQDGIRPDSITVTLFANGTAVKNPDGSDRTLTITSSNSWIGTFEDLPVYQDGTPITYTVKETAIDGYTMTDSEGNPINIGSVANGQISITNKHTPETISLTVTKQWDDQNNNDGKRPYAVEIELLQNGVKYRSVKLAGTATNLPLTHTWDNLPRYANGTIITYTVVETGYYTDSAATTPIPAIPDGYYVDHFYSTQNPELFAPNLPHPHALVVNKYTPAVVSLNIQKVWDDDNNRDGLRPESLTFQIWKTTDATAAGKIPSAENGWTALNTATMTKGADGQWWDITVNDLPKYEDQKLVYYSATEISHTDKTDTGTVETATVPEGYEVSYELDVDDYVLTVKNSHTVSRVDITVSKEWDDENDQDGKRPESVQVTLYANGIRLTSTGTTVELNEQNGWTHKWDDLLEYYNGKKIVYTVVEKEVEHYTTSYALAKDDQQKDIPNSWIITNSHETELISIPVNKIWEDDANRDGVRPDSVTVSVYNGNNVVDTLELSAANNWSGTTVELPKYSGGAEIDYTVEETAYTAKTETKPGLPDGYTAAVTGSAADGYTITNARASETVTITATKEWNDDEDRDGKRPTSITLHLIANGVHMGENYKRVVTPDANGNWTATWTGLYKYNSGDEIIYAINEEITTHPSNQNTGIASQEIEDYIPSYEQDATNPYNWKIINTYTPESTEVTVTKIWNDGDNRDGLRPTSVDIKLVRVYYKDVNGEQVEDHREDVETVTLSEANSWTYSWSTLPKFENGGDLIVYQVEESTVPTGYTAVVKADEHVPGYFIVTNTHVPETTGVSVTKLWADEENNDGKRPDGIIVQLFADDNPVIGTKVVLSEINDWTQNWKSNEQLPLYVYQTLWNETEQKYVTTDIHYDVKEIGYVLAGKEYTGDPEDYGYVGSENKNGYVITITNTRASEKISVSVDKVWADQDNNDGIRPEEVTVTLLKDGTAIQTVKLSKDNQWKHTWTDLYKYQGGVLVDYTVEETAVTGYTATYAQAANDPYHWTVTNTHANAEQTYAVQKVWKDNGDLEGLRPKSVTVQIYKNGTAYGDKITLSAQNNWESPISLPVYENGEKITWTIKELEIPRYYTVSYDQSTLTVTNTIQSTEVPKTGDFNNLWMWVLMFAGCMTGAVTVLLIGRKKKES